jgi:AcrR family transcriptional regulator
MRRETILDAGRKLFKDKGFEATTVDEIATVAELGKGTIYSYFKSKDEIYIAILETEFEVLKEWMNQAIAKATSAVNALNNLYETFIQYNRERRGFIEAVFVQVDQQSSVRLGDAVIGLREKSSEWAEMVTKVLQWGIERGEFDQFEVDKMAKTVIGLILGLIVQSEMGQIKEDLSTYRDTISRLILESIIKRPSA